MYKKILLTSISLLIISGCTSTEQNASLPQKSKSIEAQMLEIVNNMRTKGASCSAPTTPMYWNQNLALAAAAHSKDMAVNKFVRHIGSGTITDPAKSDIGMGSTFIDRIKFYKYPVVTGSLVGENITRLSIKTTGSPDFIKNFKRGLEVIYKDEAHCKILMNPRFTDVAAQMYKSDGSYYFAIEFGERKK